MGIPTVNKAVSLENPPHVSVANQEKGFLQDVIQTSADQSNGLGATQDQTKQMEQSGLETEHQGGTADPEGDSAGSPLPEEAVPQAEVANQDVMVFVDANASAEELGEVAENLNDPRPSASEDNTADCKDGKTVLEGKRNPCLDPAREECVDGDVNISVAYENESLDKQEPVKLLSKVIQSKGTSICEGPPISTRHISGLFKQGLLSHPYFSFVEYIFFVRLDIICFHA